MTDEKYIPLHTPLTGEEEEKALIAAVRSGKLGPDAAYTRQFEEKIKQFTGARHITALQSGTAALHLLLKAMGIGKNDRVILPVHTFVATANPVLYVGAEPVLTDVETDTYNMAPAYLERAIEKSIAEGKKPAAVILVHMYGLAAKTDEIATITRHYGIPLIEDAAEAIGTFDKERHAGTIGDAGFLSFNSNKTLTAAGGGAAIVPDKAMAEYIAFLARQAKENYPYYYHKEPGYNYQLSNLQAAAGMAQFAKAEKILRRKREIHRFYKENLQDLPVKIVEELPGARSNYWLNLMEMESGRPADLIDFMQGRRIEVRHVWYPLHRMPLFANAPYFGNGETEALFNRAVVLPSGPALTDADLERVVRSLHDFFRYL